MKGTTIVLLIRVLQSVASSRVSRGKPASWRAIRRRATLDTQKERYNVSEGTLGRRPA